ncbi:DMT family transporter [Pseudomonas sp. DC3000-4b1]|uniref:DMT family transporter n=1 Tax=unclassified Pseudomonas TaxID=196821 RepID=UPI003CEA1540
MSGLRKSMLTSDLMLLAVAVVWGTSYGVVKAALMFYPALGLLALRFTITFLLLSPALAHLRQLPPSRLLGLMASGMLLLGVFLCETFGILHTTATNAAFLISLTVILTPLVEWVWLKRRPSGREWAAVGLSIAGASLLGGGTGWAFNVGDALMLAAALIRSLQVCLLKRVTQNTELPALTVTALQSGMVALGSGLLLILCVPAPLQGLLAIPSPGAFWSYLAYLVGACTLFAFFAQNYALKRSSPTRVALLMGSEPVFGALFAVLWLGEGVSYQGWLGGGLIVAGCLLASVQWERGLKQRQRFPARSTASPSA